MSILFADDFMGYGTDSSLLLNGLWGTMAGEVEASPDPNDPAGTKCLHFSGVANGARRPFSVGAVGIAGTALRLWLPGLPGSIGAVIRYLDGASALQANLCITPTGAMQVYRGVVGHGGVLLADTEIPVLVANAFNHIEFKTLCDAAVGTVEARVNGIPVLSESGLNTGTALQLGLGSTDDWTSTPIRVDFIKDLVQWDGDGTHNNDFLGSVSVLGMTPDSDVSLGWTPSMGATGWNLLNLSPPNDGVDYLTAPYPPPDPSIFTLTDLPINVTSVRGMITQTRARKVDGGDGNLQSSLVSSGDSVDGSDRPITTAFTYYEDVFEDDPHTTAPWTPAAANAAEVKINRTT